MGFTENDKGITFTYRGSEQRRHGDRHEFYGVGIPEGATLDDALDVVLSHGFARQGEGAWHEPYARIHRNSTINLATKAVDPAYELVLTWPSLD